MAALSSAVDSVMVKGAANAAPFTFTRSSSMSKASYWLIFFLVLVLFGLQYRLWVGEGSLAQVTELKQQISEQRGENERLQERNRVLEAEVMELKKGMETVEERARHELGMVKDGETLYQLAE